ncbi:hypothetical protein OF83DRAFT_849260 [Amylostereum chailletii]|nr:hypothetical protein OF83DRAFT_849260 [Amylostereum chailletii]
MRPTTRSRTGKLPGASNSKSTAPSASASLAATDDEVWVDHDDSSYSESDDDHEEIEDRMAKRGRTTVKAPSKRKQPVKSTPQRKNKGRLQALPSMPLDILYEIFGHLAPSDLVRLSRVTKAFRQLLVSKQSVFLWKQAFEDLVGTPPSPPDISELEWANLLFGGSFCQNCGAKSVHKILFALRRRLCNSCITTKKVATLSKSEDPFSKNVRLVKSGNISIPPRYGPYLSPYNVRRVLPTYISYERRCTGWWLNQSDVNKFFEDLDTFSEGARWSQFEFCVQDFISIKEQDMVVHNEHTQKCVLWERMKAERRNEELAQSKKARQNQITSLFLGLGFVESDLSLIWNLRDVSVAKPLTDKAWERLYPILEPIARRAKEHRLEVELHTRRINRTKVVQEIYWNIVKASIPPGDVPFMPSPKQCCEVPSVQEVVERDVPEVTDQWRSRVETIIQSEITPIRDAMSALKRNLVPTHASLDLATTVFQQPTRSGACYGYSFLAMFNGPTSFMHRRYNDSFKLAEPDFRARDMIIEILHELDLDEKVTTTLKLDDLDARFFCNTCQPVKQWDGAGHNYVFRTIAYTWRSLVDHCTLVHSTSRGQFRQLTAEETAKAREYTESSPHNPTRQLFWGCLHCNDHLPDLWSSVNWWDLDTTKEHLNSRHAIIAPVENIDYFWSPASAMTRNSKGVVAFPISDSQGSSTD